MASDILHHRICAHCGGDFTVPLRNPPIRQSFCSVACRLWAKLDRSGGPNSCWNFTGNSTSNGYGKMYVEPREVGAHRIAFSLVNGPIPEGQFVCHKCDNRLCCNPAHLFVGTHKDNMRDMKEKGRAARSEETKKRIGDTLRGRPRPPEVVARVAASLRGKPSPQKGKPNGRKGIPKPGHGDKMRAIYAAKRLAKSV